MTNEHDDDDALGAFHQDLPYGHLYFVVAKRPHEELDVDFERLEVDGEPVRLNRPEPVPGNQGYWIDVGTYAAGIEIEVKWQIRTGIRVPETETLFAHCPNGKLTKLVRLERRQLERFETYVGKFKATPEMP